jgi:hypothetical protein
MRNDNGLILGDANSDPAAAQNDNPEINSELVLDPNEQADTPDTERDYDGPVEPADTGEEADDVGLD